MCICVLDEYKQKKYIWQSIKDVKNVEKTMMMRQIFKWKQNEWKKKVYHVYRHNISKMLLQWMTATTNNKDFRKKVNK